MQPPEHGELSRADGRTMAYRRFGHGPDVVCLAGGPGAPSEYLEDLGGLSRTFTLILPDARGTGHSAPAADRSGCGFAALADDVECLREHLGFEKLRLLAHSAACTTALMYASRHPERIGSMVLVAPSSHLLERVADDTGDILERRRSEAWYEQVVAARARSRGTTDPVNVADLVNALAPASYARWGDRERSHASRMQASDWDLVAAFWQSDVDAEDLRARLRTVDGPVLVTTGELDAATGVAAGAAWARCFPHGRHQAMDGVAHIPWVDRPGYFAELVSSFLAHPDRR